MSEFPEEFSEEFERKEEGEEELPAELLDLISRQRKADQDSVNDGQNSWLQMYGFPHECSCATDVESGNTVVISECYAGAASEAFANLRRVRGFLYAMATSPTENVEVLKLLAAEAYHEHA